MSKKITISTTMEDGTKIELSLDVQENVDYSTQPAELKKVFKKVESMFDEIKADMFRQITEDIGKNLLFNVLENKLSNSCED